MSQHPVSRQPEAGKKSAIRVHLLLPSHPDLNTCFVFSAGYSKFNNLSLCYLPANYHRLDRLDTPNDQLHITAGDLHCVFIFIFWVAPVPFVQVKRMFTLDKRMILAFTEYIYIYIFIYMYTCIYGGGKLQHLQSLDFLVVFSCFFVFFCCHEMKLANHGKLPWISNTVLLFPSIEIKQDMYKCKLQVLPTFSCLTSRLDNTFNLTTLPKLNIALKNDGWKTTFLFGFGNFSGATFKFQGV